MGSGLSNCRTQQEVGNKKSRDCNQCCKCNITSRPIAVSTAASGNHTHAAESQHSRAIDNKQNQVTNRETAGNAHEIKLYNNGKEENAKSSGNTVYSPDRKKFFYYPKHNNSGRDKKESVFVSSSQFPYTKPKIVVVRPRPSPQISIQAKVNNQDVPIHVHNDVNNVHGREFLMYNEEYPRAPCATREQNIPYHFVNDRRWTNPNVIPTDNHQNNTTLTHKTVLELRRSSQVQPYGRHYSYVCDMEPSVHCETRSDNHMSRDRPPTPDTNIWYPARRTSDYLVASSLLAAEQTRERQKYNKIDIHDF